MRRVSRRSQDYEEYNRPLRDFYLSGGGGRYFEKDSE